MLEQCVSTNFTTVGVLVPSNIYVKLCYLLFQKKSFFFSLCDLCENYK